MLYVQAVGSNRDTKKESVLPYNWVLGVDSYNNSIVLKAFGQDTAKLAELEKYDLIVVENAARGGRNAIYEFTHYATNQTTLEILGKKVDEKSADTQFREQKPTAPADDVIIEPKPAQLGGQQVQVTTKPGTTQTLPAQSAPRPDAGHANVPPTAQPAPEVGDGRQSVNEHVQKPLTPVPQRTFVIPPPPPPPMVPVVNKVEEKAPAPPQARTAAAEQLPTTNGTADTLPTPTESPSATGNQVSNEAEPANPIITIVRQH